MVERVIEITKKLKMIVRLYEHDELIGITVLRELPFPINSWKQECCVVLNPEKVGELIETLISFWKKIHVSSSQSSKSEECLNSP